MSKYNGMRFTAAGASGEGGFLGDIILRAAQEGVNPLSTEGMRTAGFRGLQSLIDSDFGEMRAAAPAPLPERAQIVLDNAVVQVGRERLQFVQDLLDAGLTYNLTDPLSVTFLEHYNRGRAATARRVMNPDVRGENSLALMSPARLPVYLTMANFELGIRELRMSQRIGLPLDTAGIQDNVRAVNESIEDAAINGATTLDGQALTVDTYTAPGLLNAPNANTKSLSLADWVTTPNGTNIMLAISQMIAQAVADKKYGPYRLYVPTAVGIGWQNDFKANGNDSIMTRLRQIENLQAIKTLDMLPSTKVALVQMTSDVVELVDGIRPTVIPFTSLNGFVFHNIVMACLIPRFRSDYDGNSGIVIGTLS
jgi:hypothetical protein